MNLPVLEQLKASWLLLVSALQALVGGSESVVSFEWQQPLLLLLLPLPLLVYLFLRHRKKDVAALVLPGDFYLPTESAGGRLKGTKGWLITAFIAWILLVVASARPTWVGPPLDAPVSGRDLLMAIDISGSMRESDLYSGNNSYSRIDVVRQVASEFVGNRTGDRVGLIMFGSNAYVQTPLTFDHQTVAHFIREAVVGLAGRSTAIGDAIGLGVKRLRERPVDARVLLLLTDGANSAGVVDPLDAARVAAENNIRIHTIGVGSDSQQSILGMRFRTQASELDEKTLIKIAELTNGQYFRARDVAELRKIYALIDELEPVESEESNFRIQHELYMWPLGLSLLLSMLIVWLWQSRVDQRYEQSI